jgi:hypothetical protein
LQSYSVRDEEIKQLSFKDQAIIHLINGSQADINKGRKSEQILADLFHTQHPIFNLIQGVRNLYLENEGEIIPK